MRTLTLPLSDMTHATRSLDWRADLGTTKNRHFKRNSTHITTQSLTVGAQTAERRADSNPAAYVFLVASLLQKVGGLYDLRIACLISCGVCLEGIVKFYNRQKGFGFIENGQGPDIYFSREDLIDQNTRVHKSDRLTFEVHVVSAGKLRAKRVRQIAAMHEQPRFVMT